MKLVLSIEAVLIRGEVGSLCAASGDQIHISVSAFGAGRLLNVNRGYMFFIYGLGACGEQVFLQHSQSISLVSKIMLC